MRSYVQQNEDTLFRTLDSMYCAILRKIICWFFKVNQEDTGMQFQKVKFRVDERMLTLLVGALMGSSAKIPS